MKIARVFFAITVLSAVAAIGQAVFAESSEIGLSPAEQACGAFSQESGDAKSLDQIDAEIAVLVGKNRSPEVEAKLTELATRRQALQGAIEMCGK